jgi:hypothetical protein
MLHLLRLECEWLDVDTTGIADEHGEQKGLGKVEAAETGVEQQQQQQEQQEVNVDVEAAEVLQQADEQQQQKKHKQVEHYALPEVQVPFMQPTRRV